MNVPLDKIPFCARMSLVENYAPTLVGAFSFLPHFPISFLDEFYILLFTVN